MTKKYILACTRCGTDVDIEEIFGGWVKNLDTAIDDCLCPCCLVLHVSDLEKEIDRLEEIVKELTNKE